MAQSARFHVFNKKTLNVLIISVWFSLVTAIAYGLTVYASWGGNIIKPPLVFPHNQIINLKDKPTMIIFFHPQCSCSDATLGELERLMPNLQNKVDVHLVFYQPEDKRGDWLKSSLWNSANELKKASIHIDVAGVLAKTFNVENSGQTFIYDKDQSLKFSGGITPARGHRGDSRGRDWILSWISNSSARDVYFGRPFGCKL